MLINSMGSPLSIVVLISGSGSNLQAIIDEFNHDISGVRISAVISNKASAYGLERAKISNIPTAVVDHKKFSSREEFDAALQKCIDQYTPDLLVLAGFMRILTEGFVRHYLGRMINIHPSLLPNYKGINTHQRVLDAGDKEHGASVHYVTPELDGGPIIIQAVVPVCSGDTAETLAKRVLAQEHTIFPRVIRWIAEGRLKLKNDLLIFDGKVLEKPIQHSDKLQQ